MGALLILILAAGALRLTFFQPTFDSSHIASYSDSGLPLGITGLVIDQPDVRDTHINLRLQAEFLHADGESRPVAGLVLVQAPRYPERTYGERLRISGRLETPPIFDTFDYRAYLARSGIHALMRRPQVELIAANQGNPLWATLLAFKAHASKTIDRILAEPHASLLNGILLGVEDGIPRNLYAKFNETGTSHVIVISGSNIALIAGLFLLLGRRTLGKRFAPPLAIVGIGVYTLLVGADAAVSRAAVMGFVLVIAIWSGRPGAPLNGLFLSALVLTLINPLTLWDVGFQLSFLATLGLILLVPPLERLTFGFLERRLKTEQLGLSMALLSELLIITLAAQIITGPLIVYHFGRLSLVSLFSNLLILPAQPPIMLVGGLATLAGMLWLPLGQLLGWLVWLPLAWTVWVVEATARLPFASLDLGTFPIWLLILIYSAIGAGVWWANQPRESSGKQPRFRLPELGLIENPAAAGQRGPTSSADLAGDLLAARRPAPRRCSGRRSGRCYPHHPT